MLNGGGPHGSALNRASRLQKTSRTLLLMVCVHDFSIIGLEKCLVIAALREACASGGKGSWEEIFSWPQKGGQGRIFQTSYLPLFLKDKRNLACT